MKQFLENPIGVESLSSLFSQAPVGLAILMGENLVIENANQQMLNFWQKDNNVIGLPILKALPEIVNQEFPKILKSVFETGETYKGSKVKALLEKNGVLKPHYFDFIYAPIYKEEKIIGISLVATNVTDYVLSENKLVDSERLFKEFMEVSDFATAIFKGEDLIIDFANSKIIEVWGKTKDVVGMRLEHAVPELVGQPFIDILKNIFITKEPYISKEAPADLVVDGVLQTFYFSFSYSPLINEEGDVYAIMDVAVDVTELVNSRKNALESAKEYRELAEAMPQIVWTADVEGKLLYYNENMLTFLDLPKNDMSAFNFFKVVHPDDFINLKNAWRKAAKEKKMFELEYRYKKVNSDEYVWFLNRATPILDDQGEVKNWIGTSTNINEFKILSSQKDTFLGIASHELKTPLTSLKLYAQVLERMLRKTGDEKNAEFAKKMDLQIVKLTSLIGDLLDVTKINAGKIYLNENEFDFEKLVIETVEDQKMSTSCTIDFTTNKVGMVFADRDRIGQVITNLISNAIKYSPNAEKIIVNIENVDSQVQFSVKDFGIGMPEDKKDRVFEQYYRVSGDEQTVFPGLGLGLYISAQIIERSNGKIWVKSVLGKGSTFYFSLPKFNS